ncbi:hypothetical protein [Peribacillus sp. ACCC06369]|uniref:hypothetical protein n=1 Tax=Peribacillus sp. ACCC06369 TaxID=3055860 RepID=UPI0025A0FDC9|nr:hypothetical protein [Peribacillus sp. ACCC06369]
MRNRIGIGVPGNFIEVGKMSGSAHGMTGCPSGITRFTLYSTALGVKFAIFLVNNKELLVNSAFTREFWHFTREIRAFTREF